MTWGGGKHHQVGDLGQRYEIRATGYPKDGESVIGWTDDIEGAFNMASSVRLAPGCTETRVVDRQKDGQPARSCGTCRHLIDDDFAPDWCRLQQKSCSEERAEGDCGKAGDLWEAKDAA